jgi:tetratricopeptide (TPR) repeat protein
MAGEKMTGLKWSSGQFYTLFASRYEPMSRIASICAIVLVVSLAGSMLVLHRLDQLRAGTTLEEVLYIPSPKILKRISLGFNGLLADIYWTRAVQYFGSHHHDHALRYDLLAPLLESTTELDPQLIAAYQFGAIFLAQKPPEGAGDPEAAIALVEKGVRANPSAWKLYFNLGWIQYDRKDYVGASKAFERASQVPGAPPAMKVMAASMVQHAGERQTARYLWSQIYNTTEDPSIRRNAIKRLRALQVDDEVDALEGAVQSYKQASGRYPTELSELQSAGWRGAVVDPLGHPYVLKPGGRVEVQSAGDLPFISKGLPPDQNRGIEAYEH